MDDLKLIKKHYGEKMMHLSRELFPTILEEEGKLFKILEEHFDYSKELYDDIIDNELQYEFKNYIYSLSDIEIIQQKVTKTPQELMDEAGYILYECKTYGEVKQFKKYYKSDEELCTFRDIEGRLNRCHVFFAVKKDVDQIRREDFKNPERQDKYGTSVISIQFTKGNINTLSIKNRYNHTVSNPDATFSNNLENIKEGLTEAFNKEYKLNINSNISNFEIPNYVLANDGKYYKYNYEIGNIYYCPNNIIIDNFEVMKYDKERYIILDYFILDMKEKTINLYDKEDDDGFVDGLQDINKIEIRKLDNEKEIIINEDIIIKINNLNQIIGYENTHLNELGDCFLYYNKILKEIKAPNVDYIRNNVLGHNEELEKIDLSNATYIGDCFLYWNKILNEIKVPNVDYIGNYVLGHNEELEKIDLSNATYIGNEFLEYNKKLKEITVPNVDNIGSDVLRNNEELEKIDLPKTTCIGAWFLRNNNKLKEFKAPILNIMRHACLCNISELEVFDVPEHIKEQFNIKEVKPKVKQKTMTSFAS